MKTHLNYLIFSWMHSKNFFKTMIYLFRKKSCLFLYTILGKINIIKNQNQNSFSVENSK